ncbi:MOP flippase family protein [Paenibacillus sp. 453mf]|uniref:MOP flippase family protein n=1 Tax=Paenibacillus sp. 453mf TaxID=1761874 RepID=UPI0008F1F8BB|nr:MOP flippase family protein [Paenibacillus sp. 453mf]SFS38939.1 polysaccharide transporter, PST family [Paenibacillus sp. 453mf]
MSLKQAGINASKWSSTATILITLIQLIQLGVLSRLLTATDYGLMGIVTVIVGFAQIYTDAGISNAIMHHKDMEQRQLSSLYYLNVASGIIVLFLVVILSPLIAGFYSEPGLIEPLIWISLVFAVIPIGQQFQILFQKELEFNKLAIFDITATITGFIVAVISAIAGSGVLALVWGQLTNSSVKSLLLFLFGIRRWPLLAHFKFNETRKFLSFGFYQMAEKTVHFISTNLPNIIIGRFFGIEALGYYTFAFQIIIIPIQKIVPIFTQISLPLFAKVHEDQERLKRGYLKVMQFLGLINFPIYLGLIVVSPEFIPIVFGQKWIDSTPIVQILCGMGLLRSTISPISSLFIAKGRADLSFRWTCITMIFIIPGIVIGGIINGVIGIAIGYLLAQCFLVILNYLYSIRKLLGPCLKDYFTSFMNPFILSLIMAALVFVLQIFVNEADYLSLASQVFIGVISYCAINFLLNRDVVLEVVSAVFKKSQKVAL